MEKNDDYRHISVHDACGNRIIRLPCETHALAMSPKGSCMLPMSLIEAFAGRLASGQGNDEDRGGGIEKNPRGAEGGNADA